MNVFVLSECPVESAKMMCDKHIPKMIVESAQMLSTAHRILDGKEYQAPSKSGKRMVKHYLLPDSAKEAIMYKSVHAGHPCTVWTMASKANYDWHYEHFLALCSEFEYRFNKQHLTYQKLKDFLKECPANMPDIGLTEFAQAMAQYPQCIVKGDAVKAYRNYYHESKYFAKWVKGRPAPSWWEGYQGEQVA
jgi:hypothetical protein|tara:strand:+ start:158 stop:730 length:573 start_codon:yes stop_codon:yes gene_type:complete